MIKEFSIKIFILENPFVHLMKKKKDTYVNANLFDFRTKG